MRLYGNKRFLSTYALSFSLGHVDHDRFRNLGLHDVLDVQFYTKSVFGRDFKGGDHGRKPFFRISCVIRNLKTRNKGAWIVSSRTNDQGPVARSMVSANHWFRSIESYAFLW